MANTSTGRVPLGPNISDFNNEWNKSALEMAWRERDAYWAAEARKPKPTRWQRFKRIFGY